MRRSTVHTIVCGLALLTVTSPESALAREGAELDLSFQLGGTLRYSDPAEPADDDTGGGLVGAKVHYTTPSHHGFTAAARWYGDVNRGFIFAPLIPGELPMLGFNGAYAYQVATKGKAQGKKTWFELLPQAGLTLGYVFARDFAATNPAQDSGGFAIGPHLGVDFNLHIKNFFLGFGTTYDASFHTGGPVSWSHRPTFYMSFGGRIMD